MALVKLSTTERRRLSAFITCLVFATIAWVFTTLSNKYTFTVKQLIAYRNAPVKRVSHSLQPDTITATLQGTGWQMLFSKINAENKVITVDLQQLANKDYVVLSSQLKQINSRKEFDEQVMALSPDTLFFDFLDRAVKRVPVQLVSNIKYQHQFTQSNDVIIKPSYVTISGSSSAIDKIKSWNTDTLKLDSVSETAHSLINLQTHKEGGITVLPRTVQVTLPVDEFTEKTIAIPVKLLNNHNYYIVKVFPQKVKVTFMVALNKYTVVDDDFFEATVDLNLWQEKGYTTLPIKLTQVPKYCKIVKIEPQNVDFIVRK